MYANHPVPPPRPPRRTRGPRNLVIAAIAAGVLMFGGCSAVVGALAAGGAKEPAAPVAATPSPTTPAPSRRPRLTVPDLAGMNAQDAQDKLDDLGFTRVHVGSDDGSVPLLLSNWTVKSQSVPAGKKVDAGRSITLTLTRPENASGDDPTTAADPGDDDPEPSDPGTPSDPATPKAHHSAGGGTVTFTVTGTAPDGVDITYGSDSSNLNGDGLPFTKTMKITDDALYYDVTAQLNGGGHIHCSITIGGKTKSGEAKGDYNICSAQLNSGPFGGWD